MAVDLQTALTRLSRLLNDDTSAIELYRANYATPEALPALRFWVQGELDRIQSGFASTDEVVKLITGVLLDVIEGIDGTVDGGQGEQGIQGDQGEPGRGVMTFYQEAEPLDSVSEPGDIWFKKAYQ